MCTIKLSVAILTVLLISSVHQAISSKDVNKEDEIDLPLTSEEPNSSKSDEDGHNLESHEAMQQKPMAPFDGFLARTQSPQAQHNKFHGGKLIIDEHEPPNHEDIDMVSEPEPTPAMLRALRNTPVQEPDPKASESLLELLVTIAGQPERWKSLIAYVDAVLKSPIALNSDLDKQLKKYKEQPEVVHQNHSTKPPLRQMEYKIEKDRKENTDSIEHMIIFLQSQHGKHRNKFGHPKTERPWPTFDVETTAGSVGIKESKRADTENLEEGTEEVNATLRKLPAGNDEKGLQEYESKYNDDNVKASNPVEEKLIDELHKLETFNKQNIYNDMDNIREYESKFDLLENTTKKNSGSRLFLKRTEYMHPGGFQQTQESNEAARNFLHNKMFFDSNKWPDFDGANRKKSDKETTSTSTLMTSATTLKPKFSKPRDWFSFRRVTIGPNENFDKTRARNAYIAVSVIAPTMRKYYRSNTEVKNDPIENELRSLKPWSHKDNLSQMKKLRATWPILESDQSVN